MCMTTAPVTSTTTTRMTSRSLRAPAISKRTSIRRPTMRIRTSRICITGIRTEGTHDEVRQHHRSVCVDRRGRNRRLLSSWLVLKQGRPIWLLLPAAVSLALFAWLLTLHPAAAGRVYAAYGGVYRGGDRLVVAGRWHTPRPLGRDRQRRGPGGDGDHLLRPTGTFLIRSKYRIRWCLRFRSRVKPPILYDERLPSLSQ